VSIRVIHGRFSPSTRIGETIISGIEDGSRMTND
jgi:hypothetical protein